MRHPDEIQLSFEVGGDGVAPDVASIKLSVALAVTRDLSKGDVVALRIISADGEMLAEAEARVVAVTFLDHFDEFGSVAFVERAHRAKVT
jgi:uncharacterized Fe-S cluster-containing radical SAM superfamily enzyme